MNITLILYIILQIMYDSKVNGLFISWKAWDVLRQKIRRRPENLRRWSATDSIYWTVSRRPSETSPSVNSGVKQWKQIPEFDRFSKRDPVNGDSVDVVWCTFCSLWMCVPKGFSKDNMWLILIKTEHITITLRMCIERFDFQYTVLL